MKMRLLITSLFVMMASGALAQDDFQKTLEQIDVAIDVSPQKVTEYENQIAETRRQYQRATKLDEKFRLAFELYEQNKSFMNDSAVYYLTEAEKWAEQAGNKAQVGNCRALQAFQCSTVGYYNEALAFLKRIDKAQLDSMGLRNYYQSQMHVYGELGYYSNIPSMKEDYFRLPGLYRDSLFSVVDHQDPDYMMWRIYQLQDQYAWRRPAS